MGEGVTEHSKIPIQSVHFDKDTYRTITMRAYSENTSIENIISDMVVKQLAMEGFLRNGLHLFHKDIVKILAEAVPEDKLTQLARKFPTLPKEMVILNVDGMKPNLKKYIKSFASFMNVNGYPVRIEENEKEGTISFFAKHGISHNYSIFWGEIIKMTLAGLVDITNEELTDTSVYLECKILDAVNQSAK
jgi:hypothetical protein